MASATLYNSAKKKLIDGSLDLDTDTIKVALLSSSYTPNIDTHVFYSDLTNELATASGYTQGGTALANKAITVDTVNDRAYLDADDVSWSASGTLTVRYAVLYKSTGVGSTSALIGYIDFTTDRTALNGEQFYIQWAAPASGAILYL